MMIVPDLTQATWRKSSRSTDQANCVEVAFVSWRKSSRSTAEANCVEVGFAPGAVAVRDTKDRDGGVLALPAASWAAFLRTQR